MKPSTIALCILFLVALALFLFGMYGCGSEPQKYMISGEDEEQAGFQSCEGQFWGKSFCPTEYEPVCATLGEIDVETNETVRTEQKTFNNACFACTYSKESMKVLGYVLGKC